MKTAISIPDSLFEEADELAQQKGISRSQLYATALKTYLDAQRKEDITEALNRIYAEEPSELDPFLAYAAYSTFKRNEW